MVWSGQVRRQAVIVGLSLITMGLQGCETNPYTGRHQLLMTSVDQEGTRKGFDIELVSSVTSAVSIPSRASGGMGSPSELVRVVREGGAEAGAMADSRHPVPPMPGQQAQPSRLVRQMGDRE